MLLQILTFNDNLNISLQAGDMIYYSPTSTVPYSGFNTINNASSIIFFGIATRVYRNGDSTVSPPIPPNSISVIYDDNAGVTPPLPNHYIMFKKNKEVNSSGLKGYFAEAQFVNYSTEKAELFSVGSEISESSK